MTRRPTQPVRVLRMLEDAGPSGLTQLDVIVRPSDGGPAILALSQRVGDLRADGHRIDVTKTRTTDGTTIARYVLVRTDSARTADGPATTGPDTPSKGYPETSTNARRDLDERPAPDPCGADALPLDVPSALAAVREAMFDIDETHNPNRGSVLAHNPPPTSCKTTEAQPGEQSSVHSSIRPGLRA